MRSGYLLLAIGAFFCIGCAPSDDPVQRKPDITVAGNVLGWKPSVALDEGLDRTIAYFRGLLAEAA